MTPVCSSNSSGRAWGCWLAAAGRGGAHMRMADTTRRGMRLGARLHSSSAAKENTPSGNTNPCSAGAGFPVGAAGLGAAQVLLPLQQGGHSV
jgi:hypothetical protein